MTMTWRALSGRPAGVGAGEVVDYFPVASPFPQPIELHAVMDTTWEPMARLARYDLPRHQTHFEHSLLEFSFIFLYVHRTPRRFTW